MVTSKQYFLVLIYHEYNYCEHDDAQRPQKMHHNTNNLHTFFNLWININLATTYTKFNKSVLNITWHISTLHYPSRHILYLAVLSLIHTTQCHHFSTTTIVRTKTTVRLQLKLCWDLLAVLTLTITPFTCQQVSLLSNKYNSGLNTSWDQVFTQMAIKHFQPSAAHESA